MAFCFINKVVEQNASVLSSPKCIFGSYFFENFFLSLDPKKPCSSLKTPVRFGSLQFSRFLIMPQKMFCSFLF